MALPENLCFATVIAALGQADALTGTGTLDLTAVSRIDSAGISLLLELSRRAQSRGQTLGITGASPQVRGLLGFFGIDKILQVA